MNKTELEMRNKGDSSMIKMKRRSLSSCSFIFLDFVFYNLGHHVSPQESHNMVTVAEYRLPEVKASTAMYFDFPRQISTRRITFQLLGDIAAFSDDPAEQDDSEYRLHPWAAGLSLANRIKLYYYADPYELGKWASLSAV